MSSAGNKGKGSWMQRVRKGAGFLFWGGFAFALFAGSARAFTLGEALDQALENNPQWKSDRLKEKLSQSERIRVMGSYLPSLAISETYINTNNPLTAFGILLNEGIVQQSTLASVNALDNPSYTQTFGFAATVSETIYGGGERFYGLQASRHQEQETHDEALWKRQTLISRVTRSFLDAILADREIQVIEAEQKAADADRKIAQDQWRGGRLLKADYLRANVHAVHLKIELLEAKKRLSLARLELSRLLGRKIGTNERLDAPERLESSSPEFLSEMAGKGEEALLKKALSTRPDYRSVEEEIRVRDRQVHQTLSAFLPHVSAQGIYNEYNEGLSAWGKQSYTALGQVSWNLFNGFGDTEARRRARLKLRMATYRKEDLTRALRYEVSKSLMTAIIAEKSLAADGERVAQSEEALRIVRARYQTGLEAVSRLLRAEARFREARLLALRDRYLLDESVVNLLWATGTLSRKMPFFQ
ncbi:MAG: TolC family protein [Leptospirales bacterium]